MAPKSTQPGDPKRSKILGPPSRGRPRAKQKRHRKQYRKNNPNINLCEQGTGSAQALLIMWIICEHGYARVCMKLFYDHAYACACACVGIRTSRNTRSQSRNERESKARGIRQSGAGKETECKKQHRTRSPKERTHYRKHPRSIEIASVDFMFDCCSLCHPCVSAVSP